MVNLLRVADSPLLLDQFECFVIDWLGRPKVTEFPEPEFPGLIDWLERSSAIRQYWEISQRWPDAHLEGSQDSLAKRIYDGDPVLVDENQGCWSVYLRDGNLWNSEEDQCLGISIEQFLTTFGLYEFIIGQSLEKMWIMKGVDDPLTPLEGESTLVWESFYPYPDSPLKFWFHEAGLLWVDCPGAIAGAARDDAAVKAFRDL